MSGRIFRVRFREFGLFGRTHDVHVRAACEREAKARAITRHFGRDARLALLRGSAVGLIERPTRQRHGVGWSVEPVTGPLLVSVVESGGAMRASDGWLLEAVRREIDRAGECIDVHPTIARVAAARGYTLTEAEDATIRHAASLVLRAGPVDAADLPYVVALVLLADARSGVAS